MRGVALLLLCLPAVAHEKQIAALAAQLGHEQFEVRERAQARLESYVRKHGQAAFSALEAHEAADLEAQLRLARLVNKLGRVRLLWSQRLEPSLVAMPNVTAGTNVVLVTGNRGLHALDVRNGSVLWSKPGVYWHAAPGAVSEVVYAHRPPDSVAAYRARTGGLLWAHSLKDLDGDAGRTQRVWRVERGPYERDLARWQWSDLRLRTRFVPEWRSLVINCAAVTFEGKRTWSADLGASRKIATTYASLDLKRELVFTAGRLDGTKHLYALRRADGQVAWQVPVPGLRRIGPGRVRDRVFVAAHPWVNERWDGRLYCHDAATGRRLWTFRPKPPGAQPDRPTETILTRNRRIRTGEVRHPGDETWLGGLHLVAGVLIVHNRAERFGLQPKNGEIIWRRPVGSIALAGVEHRGLVYGLDGNDLVALDPATGRVRRRVDLGALRPAHDVPKIVVQRGHLPARSELGAVSPPRFVGDVCHLATASGWVIAVRVPPFVAKR